MGPGSAVPHSKFVPGTLKSATVARAISEGSTLSSSRAILCRLVPASCSHLVFFHSRVPFPLAQHGNLELYTCEVKNMSRKRQSDVSLSG